MLRVGDQELKLAEATLLIDAYARDYASTIRFYDFDGETDRDVRPSKGPISVSDIGRLAMITSELTREEVGRLLTVAEVQWSSVAPTARLEDADYDEPDGLYVAMQTMWAHIQNRKSGIGPGKASKLLHLKRPFAFPILGRDVCETYQKRHRKTGEYWRLIRDDLIDGADDIDKIRDRLASAKNRDVQCASRLPALRLLDIIAWQLQQH
ncbi:MAG TPA: DUF6308 family protein [Acidimicrobiia bacterium]|jgi:hypothetical protein|nr:DUF6308 family protein [Acidimicrobiia bacterium]